MRARIPHRNACMFTGASIILIGIYLNAYINKNGYWLNMVDLCMDINNNTGALVCDWILTKNNINDIL